MNKNILTLNMLVLLLLMGIAIVAVWIKACPDGDIYVAIAGGRDILNGKLAQPDTWSFMTNNRIWVNQNWGADIIFYLIYSHLGQWGFLLFKLALFVLCSLFVVNTLAKRNVPFYISIPMFSLGLLSIYLYAFLRPNLIAMTIFIPLLFLLLYSSREKPAFLWFSAVLVVIWANFHGSYILGIFMMALWAGINIIKPADYENIKSLKKYRWNLALPVLISILSVGIINPFGIENITFSFAIISSTWRKIEEWKPMWADNFSLVSSGCIVFLSVFFLFLLLRIISEYRNFINYKNGKKVIKKAPYNIFNSIENVEIFEVCVALGTIAMALFSKRFVPFAVLTSIYPVSIWLWRFISHLGDIVIMKMVPVLMGIVVLIASLSLLFSFYYPYSVGNQFMDEGTFFERMQFTNSDFPVKLLEFMNTNNISGNAFCPWTWEGFVRLKCPQIKVYAGARAQQVYDEKTNENYLNLSSENPSIELLKQDNVHMLILPSNDGSFTTLIKKVLDEGSWVAIYADTNDMLLVDSQYSGNHMFIEKALKSQLVYYDANSRTLSPYALMLGTYGGISQDEKVNKFSNLSDITFVHGFIMTFQEYY